MNDSLTEQSNNLTATVKALQDAFDQKFLQTSANYSNLTSQVTAEIAALGDTVHAKNMALNNSLSELSKHIDSSHQQMKIEVTQEQKAMGDKISSLSTEIVVLRSQQVLPASRHSSYTILMFHSLHAYISIRNIYCS